MSLHSNFNESLHGRKLLRPLLHSGAALLALVCAFSVFAAGKPLSLSEAQRLAVERSRQLAAQDLAAVASREMAIAASQLPDPVLKFGIDNLPVEGADRFSVARDFMTMRRIGVMQELTRGDKRRLRAERFEREADKIMAEKSAMVAAIERDTALAWLDSYYAQAMNKLIDEQAAEVRLEIDAAQSAYRAGRGTQADLINARSALVTLQDRAAELANRARNARIMLARWIGDPVDASLAEKPDIGVLRMNAAAIEAELPQHPQISALDKQQELAETDARLAQAGKKSDWSVELMFSQRGPAYDNMISVGLSIPLQWDRKNRQDKELSARLAQLEQAKAQRDDALRAHVAEVRALFNEWNSARERLARYANELIPLSRERTQAILAAYRGTKAGLADVLAARRNEIEVRMQALQLEMEAGRLWGQINFLFPASHSAATPTNKEAK